MLKQLIIFILLSLIFVMAASGQEKSPKEIETQTVEKSVKKANQRPEETSPKEPFDRADVATMSKQCVSLTTEKGDIEMEMFPESAPETVRNFLNLTSIGVFDATTFSRVVPDFIIQGGNIATRETRTPELTRRAQRSILDEPNLIKHERGIVSMARSDEPNSASSNFFILLTTAAYLDGKFAAFGRVIKGMETVEAINKMPVAGDKPEKPVKIIRASVKDCPVQRN